MKYVNPYAFLQSLIGEMPDQSRESLSLARKKAFAEIELSPTQTVTVAGNVYSKNDIITFFDGLQVADDMAFHQFIAQDPVLTEFLQTGMLRNNGKFKRESIYAEARFLQFVAPYYEPPFTSMVLQCMKELNTRSLSDLMNNPLLLDDSNKEKSYTRIHRTLKVKLEGLQAIRARIKAENKVVLNELENYTGIYWVAVLNFLPDEEFAEFRDDYAIEMINTAIALQHTLLRRGVEILGSVRQLKCSEYVQKQNEDRYEILSRNLEAKTSPVPAKTGGGFKMGWGIISMGIFLIKIIIGISQCHS